MAKVWIPADRFIAVLDRCNIGNEDLDKAGIRRLWDLRNGRQEAISLGVADEILTKLGLAYWFRIRKEDGGLLELYTEEETYTPTWVPKARAQLAVFSEARTRKTKKCECGTPILSRSARCVACYRKSMLGDLTSEERKARKRQGYVEWSRRQDKRCECGTQITNTATRCRPCYDSRKTQTQHGTRSRYTIGCRCMDCRRAEADYARDYKRKLRAAYLEAQTVAA